MWVYLASLTNGTVLLGVGTCGGLIPDVSEWISGRLTLRDIFHKYCSMQVAGSSATAWPKSHRFVPSFPFLFFFVPLRRCIDRPSKKTNKENLTAVVKPAASSPILLPSPVSAISIHESSKAYAQPRPKMRTTSLGPAQDVRHGSAFWASQIKE